MPPPKTIRDNLGLIAIVITLGGGVVGWLGLRDLIQNTRPVWFSELVDAKRQIDIRIDEAALTALRDKRWALMRDKRLTEEAIENLKGLRAVADSAALVERQVKLESQLEWIEKGLKAVEDELAR